MKATIKCEQVWGRISDYVDGHVDTSLRQRLDRHFAKCRRCKAVLDGTRDVLKLVGHEQAFTVPPHASSRFYAKLEQHLHDKTLDRAGPGQIPVGITNDRVDLGSHLIYFWENDDEFERGVRFLYPGLGQGEHCIAFGHDEALEKVISTLRAKGFNTDDLIKNGELTILRRQASAQATLSDIGDVVQAALNSGASAVRFLGNLGMGRAPLPAGEDDVIELESKVTGLISQLPCVIVCMYDVRTLSGHLIINGGLRPHHLTVCPQGVRDNPYYSPDSELPRVARHVH